MIVLSGTIGAGKTSLTTMLAEHLGSEALYESVDDNPILPLFYEDPKRYGFLLKLFSK
jgi:deoxyadenosine/deoxycytidine kinase